MYIKCKYTDTIRGLARESGLTRDVVRGIKKRLGSIEYGEGLKGEFLKRGVIVESDKDIDNPAPSAGFLGKTKVKKLETKQHKNEDTPTQKELFGNPLNIEIASRPKSKKWNEWGKIKENRIFDERQGELELDIVMGDLHASPNPQIMPYTLRSCALIGSHVRATKAATLINIGDLGDWSSLCTHYASGSVKDKMRPNIDQDILCMRKHLDVLCDFSGDRAKRVITLGNHEHRLFRYEERNPGLAGQHTGTIFDMLKARNFNVCLYGDIFFVGGIAYTHIPLNNMGKPISGVGAENRISALSNNDLVCGHTHSYNICRLRKIGCDLTTVINAGSSMPMAYIPEHAVNTTGSMIDTGCLEIRRLAGKIISHRFVTMDELEYLYGEKI